MKQLILFACLLLVAGPVVAELNETITCGKPVNGSIACSPENFDNRSIAVLRPSPGLSQLYDQRGNSATVYEVSPHMSWYSQRDKYGTIQSQGYVFDQLKDHPLRVPDSMRYGPPQLSQ